MEKAEIEKLLLSGQADLLKYACYLTKDTNRANDLLQDTNLKIILNYEKFYGGSFKSWSFKVMYHTFINNCKRDEKYSFFESTDVPYNEIQHTANSFGNDSLCNIKDIYKALHTLPAEHCKIIMLLINGYMYKDIAVKQNIPIGTIKSRIFKSRAILGVLLKDFIM